LISVEIPKVLDCIESSGMIWTEGLLVACQCSLVHVLCLLELPLIFVENPKVVDYIESRGMI
jgi:hypothetical protein